MKNWSLPHMERRHWLAVAALFVGSAVIMRGLWLASPVRPPTPISSSGTYAAPHPVDGTDVDLFQVPVETQVSAAVLPDILDTISSRVREISVALPIQPLHTRRAELLGQAASDYVRAVLSGSSEDYLDFVSDYGGDPGFDVTDQQSTQAFETFFHSTSGNYANGRVSLEHLLVRPRVINGANIQQSDFGARTSMSYADDRFPVLAEVAYSTPYGQVIIGDTYEVLMPIEYRSGGETATILLGVWLTWSPSERWLPSRVVAYTPRATRITVVHPVF